MFEEGYDPATTPPDPQSGTVWMDLSLAEAEELARRLVLVVHAAKLGIYSNMGEELNRYVLESDSKMRGMFSSKPTVTTAPDPRALPN